MMGTPHRSWLYVPGDRPDRFAKAAASGADVVICDLEDSVGPANKALARDSVAAWLSGHRAVVRVNGVDTPWHDDDVAALGNSPHLAGVMLPKSQEPEDIGRLGRRLGGRTELVPLVETAAGVANAAAIAADPQVSVLAFGSVDFALDLGIDDIDGEEQTVLLYARSALVIASRVAGIAPPIDGVTLSLADADAIRDDTRRARALGFGGKQCIHPRQVHEVNAVFTPSREAIAGAQRVIDAAEDSRGSAVQLDGQMIDRPRIDRARRVLAAATGSPIQMKEYRS
jgi:citrate lyase subunit beta / citryl-CoA lyase